MKLEEGGCITSSDVTALFTSVSVDSVIRIIKNKLEQDGEPHNGTSMMVRCIITLLEFCLKSTHFLFQGKFFE